VNNKYSSFRPTPIVEGYVVALLPETPGTRVPVQIPDGYPGTKIPESPSTSCTKTVYLMSRTHRTFVNWVSHIVACRL